MKRVTAKVRKNIAAQHDSESICLCTHCMMPDFSKWPLQRLAGEAKRLGVPSLKSILTQQDDAMAKRELVDILTEAYS